MNSAAAAPRAPRNVNVLFFGPPGAGKGTQAALVAPALGMAHVSTGDLFRRIQGQDTPLARRVRAIMEAGEYVPDGITVAMLEQHVQSLDATQPELRGVIFDGFPRTPQQVAALDTFLGTRAEHVDGVVYIGVPLAVLLPRLLGRGRADDTPDAITTRFEKYEDATAPLLVEYERRGIPVYRVDGDQAVGAVSADVVAALSPLFAERR